MLIAALPLFFISTYPAFFWSFPPPYSGISMFPNVSLLHSVSYKTIRPTLPKPTGAEGSGSLTFWHGRPPTSRFSVPALFPFPRALSLSLSFSLDLDLIPPFYALCLVPCLVLAPYLTFSLTAFIACLLIGLWV